MTSHAEIELRIELVNQRKREAIIQWRAWESEIFFASEGEINSAFTNMEGQKFARERVADRHKEQC